MSFIEKYFDYQIPQVTSQFFANLATIAGKTEGHVYLIKRNTIGYAEPDQLTPQFLRRLKSNGYGESFKFYVCKVEDGRDLVCFLALHEFQLIEDVYQTNSKEMSRLVAFTNDLRLKLLKNMSLNVLHIPEVQKLLNVKNMYPGASEKRELDEAIQKAKEEMRSDLLAGLVDSVLTSLNGKFIQGGHGLFATFTA